MVEFSSFLFASEPPLEFNLAVSVLELLLKSKTLLMLPTSLFFFDLAIGDCRSGETASV